MTNKTFKLKLTFSTALRPNKPVYDYIRGEFISLLTAGRLYGLDVLKRVAGSYGHVVSNDKSNNK